MNAYMAISLSHLVGNGLRLIPLSGQKNKVSGRNLRREEELQLAAWGIHLKTSSLLWYRILITSTLSYKVGSFSTS